TYSVKGAMNAFEDHDELFWNVDGALWPVPKQSVSATVTLPAAAYKAAACYQGATGSTEPCKYGNTTQSVTYSSTRTLASGEQMSLVVGLDKGMVKVPAPMLTGRQRQFPQDAFEINPLTVGLGLLVLILGLALIVRFWLLHGRDRAYLTRYYLAPTDAAERLEPVFQHEPVVVEFEPPLKLRPAESQIDADAMERKFFVARPDLVRSLTIGAAIVIAVLGGALTYFLGITFGGGLIGVAMILVGGVLLAVHRAMASRTAAGREAMQKTLGFRLYMTTAEKYRQQFAEKAEIFTQLLPYAIVFGCVSNWAHAFEGIDTSATNSWYVGSAPFQAALLSSSLESMNSNLASAISVSPPSSGSGSGFGGGGFSGGGGGGGGGGSW